MHWQQEATSGDPREAGAIGLQAATFLTQAVHAEIDNATLGTIQVLMAPDSPGKAVYAAAAVNGPLRAYVATAWGRSGHVAAKEIVSYPTVAEAQAALATIVQKHLTSGGERTYVLLGTVQP